MEKIAFSLPLRGLVCPRYTRPEASNRWPDLSQRLPGQFYQLMSHSLLCFVLGLLSYGAGGRIPLAASSLFSAAVVLTASPESLVLSSPLVMEGFSLQDKEVQPPQMEDVCILSV